METWELPDGAVTIQKEGHMVRFRVSCKPPCEPSRLLRCFGENLPDDLLIGVLEPQSGRLVLDRRFSRETLRQSGISGDLPSRFYLSDSGPRVYEAFPADPQPGDGAVEVDAPEADAPEADAPEADAPEAPVPAPETVDETALDEALPKTGDVLLDEVLARGEVQYEISPEGLRISCPFSPEQPFPLAFIAPLCRTEKQNIAVLDWKIPQGT